MSDRITPQPRDYTPGETHWGSVSYVDDLREVLRRAPDGTTAMTRGGLQDRPTSAECVSVQIRDGGRSWNAYRLEAWAGDAEETEKETREIRRFFNLSWSDCATKGKMAGKLLARFSERPAPEYRCPELSDYARRVFQFPDDYRPHHRPHAYDVAVNSIQGGIIRAFRTVERDATLIDMRSAYLWAMRNVPVGQPGFYYGNRVSYRAIQQAETPCIVSVPVRTAGPVSHLMRGHSGHRVDFPIGDWHYIGWSLELDQAIQQGKAEVTGPVHWAIYWATLGDPIGPLLDRLSDSVPAPIFKELYRCIWTRFNPSSGWRGIIQESPPTSAFPVYSDPWVPWLWWQFVPASPPGPRVVSRPEISSWITASLRGRMAAVCDSYDPAVCMVDAVVVRSSERESWRELLGERPGAFHEVDAGVYLGAGPGQYSILRDGCKISRFRFSGCDRRIQNWRQLQQSALDLARSAYRSQGRFPVVPVRVTLPTGEDWIGKWPDLDLSHNPVGWYQLDGANVRRMTVGRGE